jgi:hypothetical protein
MENSRDSRILEPPFESSHLTPRQTLINKAYSNLPDQSANLLPNNIVVPKTSINHEKIDYLIV